MTPMQAATFVAMKSAGVSQKDVTLAMWRGAFWLLRMLVMFTAAMMREEKFQLIDDIELI
jgi:hypothetical protein